MDGKAPTGADVEWVAKEESYFFKLSELQDKLLEWYETNPECIAPSSRRNEVLSFVKGGLKDLSISRTSFQWGVPVPGEEEDGDERHVMYVWIDALTNYISALGYPDEGGNFGKFWPAALHVVGKDILRFHTVYWPAFLMAADLPLPERVFAHGWWTKDGEKISKSLGNVIDPVELVEKVRFLERDKPIYMFCTMVLSSQSISLTIVDQYGVDQTRFFLMAEVGFGNDGDFSDKAMVQKVNTNLANELGNLCQRVLTMVFKNCHKAVPDVDPETDFTDDDKALLASAQGLYSRVAPAVVQEQAIQKYVNDLVEMVWEANKYIDEMAPWVLRKEDPKRMEVVLYVLMEVLRYVTILYQPVIPTSADKILDLLTVPPEQRSFGHLTPEYRVQPGAPLASKPEGVFPRIELPELVDA